MSEEGVLDLAHEASAKLTRRESVLAKLTELEAQGVEQPFDYTELPTRVIPNCGLCGKPVTFEAIAPQDVWLAISQAAGRTDGEGYFCFDCMDGLAVQAGYGTVEEYGQVEVAAYFSGLALMSLHYGLSRDERIAEARRVLEWSMFAVDEFVLADVPKLAEAYVDSDERARLYLEKR